MKVLKNKFFTMSNKKQGILAKIEALFKSVESTEQKFIDYKISDGSTISCDKLEVGGVVTKDGVQAPAGEYELEDKTKIMVDAAGMITAVTPYVEQAQVPDMTTPAGMLSAYEKFANGQLDMAGISTVLKALMEYSFGWQLREAQEKATRDEALKVYQDSMKGLPAQVVAQQALLKQMFELVKEIVELPADDSPGATGKKKFSFANVEGRKKSFERFKAAALELEKKGKEILN